MTQDRDLKTYFDHDLKVKQNSVKSSDGIYET